MNYDKESFLSGVAVGRQLKGWDVANPGGGYPEPEGSITLTENGAYNVKNLATAVVDVPSPSGSLTITENGTYNVTDKAEAVVSVSGSGPEPPLPAEYQEVEYIDFTPHCGYAVTIPATFKLEVKVSPDSLGTSTNPLCPFAYRVSTSQQTDFQTRISAGVAQFYVRASGVDHDLDENVSVGDVVLIKGFAYGFRTTAFIGRYATYSSNAYHGFDGKIYYVKGWDIDGNLSFKFVPCYRKADNTPGFYDVVADVFYSTLNTTGGGSIALGPDAN